MERDIKSWVERLESLRTCLLNPEQCPHEGGCGYAAVDTCLDQIVSEMQQYLKDPISLPVFKGYIVDKRLQEFRKLELVRVEDGLMPCLRFIPFDSPKGRELLSEMEATVRS